MGLLGRFRKTNKNSWTINGASADPTRVNLEYWSQKVNLGDALAPVIYEWILSQNKIPMGLTAAKPYTHLLSVGSVLSMGSFDATVWGSGILSLKASKAIYERSASRKLDIRAVRGPLTATVLSAAGYNVPEVYGDPGILMPLIYPATARHKKHRYCLIPHYSKIEDYLSSGHYCLDIRTSDYAMFIDALLECECVISSSLHGIILAEAYGIPAILLREPELDLFKCYDYYQSTNRYSVKVALSVEEALGMEPMLLPDLHEMQADILNTFPTDIFIPSES